jgi:hypothetical protein
MIVTLESPGVVHRHAGFPIAPWKSGGRDVLLGGFGVALVSSAEAVVVDDAGLSGRRAPVSRHGPDPSGAGCPTTGHPADSGLESHGPAARRSGRGTNRKLPCARRPSLRHPCSRPWLRPDGSNPAPGSNKAEFQSLARADSASGPIRSFLSTAWHPRCPTWSPRTETTRIRRGASR